MDVTVISFLSFFSLFHSVVSYSPEQIQDFYKFCPPIDCGKLGQLRLPFTNKTLLEGCGPFVLDGCSEKVQKIKLERGKGKWYEVESISQSNTISITDTELQRQIDNRQCQSFNNLSVPILTYAPFRIRPNLTLFKCNHPANFTHFDFSYTECKNFTIYYNYMNRSALPSPPPNCSILQLPFNVNQNYDDIFHLLTANFSLEVFFWLECYWCQLYGGKCLGNSKKKFQCLDAKGNLIRKTKRRKHRVVGGLAAVAVMLSIIFIQRHRRRKHISSIILSTISSSNPSSSSGLEADSVYFEVPIFSFVELEEATGNFHPEKELGNGGFGAVYYGILRDGGEVAVKRLYEHDYRRVQQFMNEIEILTRLRHKNLVSLYGCTSRRSRELLLVYEYIPKGTIADHLHGNQANSSPLTWAIRLRIATETASALAYLHASDIIHRDVKTNNILLDSNYIVKVADFGLSRLFPSDATHISTAPQGTPGYLDPEYYQCYQLTNKSDVYSFGVVLIELVSSMPAVDMSRHRHEINLANLAMNKIRKREFDELIDPRLGHHLDKEVNRMITSVAELAFQCLQQDKEMRPSMEEVLQQLQTIETGGYELENPTEGLHDNKVLKSMKLQPPQPDCDEIALLKNIRPPPSPNSVNHKWVSSGCSSSNFSC
ncbi:LEAF RUST 10 DISEASE-RESISTANCE LOCUS RECEPTOR-LIKE PROTEIN KINASE-like 1.1 isoform X2 [Jatropha curcas]|nr:LEAF RUST 10 DISEASE-RESISTANCE LOCUS RECEPTOR-LIKE PROTEIN KINASE-like 1.1 isoform X2 [Jatropha curcas]